MARPKVNVTGWYDHSNCGDEAYKLAFPIVFPNIDFVFSDKVLPDFDAYILGGGDTVTEYFTSSFKKITKPKHILSVTMPDKIERSSIDHFQTIGVRDFTSLEKVASLGLKGTFTPDFGLRLIGDPLIGRREVENIFAREKHDLYSKVFGVVINGHLSPHHGISASDHLKFERFSYDLAAALDATNASFLFIPFGYRMPWDDRLANSSVASRCKFWKKNVVVYEELSIQKTLNIISSLDGMISTRLHSTIFSLSNKIPFIDITHNHKNKRLLSTMSYEDASILYSEFSYQKCLASIHKILANKKAISQEIQNLLNIQIACLKGVSDNVHLV